MRRREFLRSGYKAIVAGSIGLATILEENMERSAAAEPARIPEVMTNQENKNVLNKDTPESLQAFLDTLPNPLVKKDGMPITNARQWPARRAEIRSLFTEEMYGRVPGRPEKMAFHVLDNDPKALDGKATRRQIRIDFMGDPNGPHMDLLVYLPNSHCEITAGQTSGSSSQQNSDLSHQKQHRTKGRVPIILGLNFWGNHAIHADPGIRLATTWMEESKNNPWVDLSGVHNHRATDTCRGVNASQWPIERIIDRGYGVATAYRGDIDPDHTDSFNESIRAAYPDLQGVGDNFSAIGGWAWSLSRAMDYLQTDKQVDAKRVAVWGWSRLGKAALWAGATDERFALVISNESGAGGAKLFRHGIGENILRLNTVFPHWYCQNFRKYNGLDTTLPFDQHMMLSLIAPRPLYIASAIEDVNADPKGEFAATRALNPVYALLGASGMPADVWPSVDHPIMGRIGYHVRSGNHAVTDYDWTQFLAFADKYLTEKTQNQGNLF